MAQKKNIVIIGAGFGGLAAALRLEKRINHDLYTITVIDERDSHTYTPDLYEIATAFNNEITQECLTQLKDTVAIPLKQIFFGTHIVHLHEKITRIDPKKRRVYFDQNESIEYTRLLLALGSVVNYYKIPGLEENALTLKTAQDALKMSCHLDAFFHELWKKGERRTVRFVVGGGGATGVELACELAGYIKKLCVKYTYSRSACEVVLVEARNILAGGSAEVTDIILKRFKTFGIKTRLETVIKKVDSKSITISSKTAKSEKLPYDLLVWTGGVQAHPLIAASFSKTAPNGSLPVNGYLHHAELKVVYAVGDNACILDPVTKKPVPLLAQLAHVQGRLAAENIAADLQRSRQKIYRPHDLGHVTPLGGRYGIFMHGEIILKGWGVWVLRRLIDLKYAMTIMPRWKAFTKWLHDTRLYTRNDM